MTQNAWSTDELTNTISAGAVMSNVVDPQSVVEDSNIVGQNISITTGGMVGNSASDLVMSVQPNGGLGLDR